MGNTDRGAFGELARLERHYTVNEYDPAKGPMICQTVVRKYSAADFSAGRPPYETITHTGNLRYVGGASVFWERLITKAPSTSSTGAALQAFSSDNALIAVSTSTAARSKTSTGIGGSPVYSTLSSAPGHTDSNSSTGAQSCQFKASWGTTSANFAWRSWGVCNSTGTGQRWLNQVLQNLGTKTTGTWTLTVTLTEAT